MARATALKGSLRDLRRGQILAAARAIVAADGLEALTIGALEKSLGYSRGVITYHFADKDEIVEAVLLGAVAEIDAHTSEEFRSAVTLVNKVRAVLRTKIDGFLKSPEASRVLLAFWGRMVSDVRARKLTAKLFAGYRAQGAWLARHEQGRIDPQRAEAMGALFVGVVLGLVVMQMIQPACFDVEKAIDEAAHAFAQRLAAR